MTQQQLHVGLCHVQCTIGHLNNNSNVYIKYIITHRSVLAILVVLVAVWLIGNIDGRINEVTLRRAGLVLRWVTIREYAVLVSNQATQAHSAWPSLRS